MAIGNIEPMIYRNRAAPAADPEQERAVAAQAGLIVNEAEPLNCETPPLVLGGEVTPTSSTKSGFSCADIRSQQRPTRAHGDSLMSD